jgi:hypothetical protein
MFKSMKSFFIILFHFVQIFILSKAGDIIPYDIRANYNNQGQLSIIDIPFTLQNKISAWDFIRIDFPTGFTLSFNGTYAPVGYWAAQSTTCDLLAFDPANVLMGYQSS